MTTELAFVAALRALATDPAARGLDDDCAVLELGGEALVLTHDMMVAGVHFLADQDPADVAPARTEMRLPRTAIDALVDGDE